MGMRKGRGRDRRVVRTTRVTEIEVTVNQLSSGLSLVRSQY